MINGAPPCSFASVFLAAGLEPFPQLSPPPSRKMMTMELSGTPQNMYIETYLNSVDINIV